jgi:Tfp pilus assembly protein PilW
MHARLSHPHSPPSRQAAYTLIEMMLAVGIFLFLVCGIISVSLFTARSFAALGNYSNLDRDSRYALDVLTRDIRKSAGLSSFATNEIRLMNLDGSSLADYKWDPANGHLTRTAAGVTRNLLTECDSLTFSIFQRNQSGNFTFYPAGGNLSEAKLVSVQWQCSRQMYAQKINTETVQTAKIVIRN